eukprot:4270_1
MIQSVKNFSVQNKMSTNNKPTFCSRCVNIVSTPHTIENCPFLRIKKHESIQNPFTILVTNSKYLYLLKLTYIYMDVNLFISFCQEFGYIVHIQDNDLDRDEILNLFHRALTTLKETMQTQIIDGIVIALSGHGTLSLEGFNLFLTNEFHTKNNPNAHISVDEIFDIFRDPTNPTISALPKVGIFDFCRSQSSRHPIKSNYKPQKMSSIHKENETQIFGCTRGDTSKIRSTGSVMWLALFTKLLATKQAPRSLHIKCTETAKELSDDNSVTQTIQYHCTNKQTWFLCPKQINFKMNAFDAAPDLTIVFSSKIIKLIVNSPGISDMSHFMLLCNNKSHQFGPNILLNDGGVLNVIHGTNEEQMKRISFDCNKRKEMTQVWFEDILMRDSDNKLFICNSNGVKCYQIDFRNDWNCSNNSNNSNYNQSRETMFSWSGNTCNGEPIDCKQNDNNNYNMNANMNSNMNENNMNEIELLNDISMRNENTINEMECNINDNNMNEIEPFIDNGLSNLETDGNMNVSLNCNDNQCINIEDANNCSNNVMDIDDDEEEDANSNNSNEKTIMEQAYDDVVIYERNHLDKRKDELNTVINNTILKIKRDLNINVNIQPFDYVLNYQEALTFLYKWQKVKRTRDNTKAAIFKKYKKWCDSNRGVEYGNHLFGNILSETNEYLSQITSLMYNDLFK